MLMYLFQCIHHIFTLTDYSDLLSGLLAGILNFDFFVTFSAILWLSRD